MFTCCTFSLCFPFYVELCFKGKRDHTTPEKQKMAQTIGEQRKVVILVNGKNVVTDFERINLGRVSDV